MDSRAIWPSESNDQNAVMSFATMNSEAPICRYDETTIKLCYRPQVAICNTLVLGSTKIANIVTQALQVFDAL